MNDNNKDPKQTNQQDDSTANVHTENSTITQQGAKEPENLNANDPQKKDIAREEWQTGIEVGEHEQTKD